MSSKLLKSLVSDNSAEREAAAVEICQARMHELVDDLINTLPNKEPSIRECISMVLGVLGGDKAVEFLDMIGKNDPETDVRIAAIISKEYAGKITLQKLQKEIKVFRGEKLTGEKGKDEKAIEEKPKKKKDRPPEPEIKRISDLEDELNGKGKKSGIAGVLNYLYEKKYLSITLSVLIIIAAVILVRGFVFTEKQAGREVIGGNKTVAQFIKERIAAIDEFKSTSLNPDDPAYRLPKTLELRSMAGDTYGDLFSKVYSNILTTEEGINTLGAFWRKINFGASDKLNLINLMELETDGETLLFPNPEAINLLLVVEEGSVSYHNINSFDPDLEINIRINSVTVK